MSKADSSMRSKAPGCCHYLGLGVVKNHARSAELFAAAASQQHADALHYLGVCYQTGNGVKKDEEKANELFAQAAELGHTNSIILLRQR